MEGKLEFDNANSMWRYKTKPEDIKQAMKEYYAQFYKSNIINKKTIYDKKESRIAGLLGEIVYKKLYPDATKSENDITYDFDYRGNKVDVKCKYRTVSPKLDFEASFFKYQASRAFNADLYFFMSTVPSFAYVWMCGYGTKDEIMNNPHMEIWKAGDVDKTNGMQFREDTVCLKYKYLKQVGI